MDRLEKKKDFNPAVKIKNLEQEKRSDSEVSNASQSQSQPYMPQEVDVPQDAPHDVQSDTSHDISCDIQRDMSHDLSHATKRHQTIGEEGFGFALFDNVEASKELESKRLNLHSC